MLRFPLTPLRLYVETLGAVMQSVLDERCTIGLSGQLASAPPVFIQESLLKVSLVHVTSPQHPLATYGRPVPTSELTKHVQLVLTDRSTMSKGRDLAASSISAYVATCGSWRQTRLSTSGTGLGRDAGRTGSIRSLTGHPGEDCRRRCTARGLSSP